MFPFEPRDYLWLFVIAVVIGAILGVLHALLPEESYLSRNWLVIRNLLFLGMLIGSASVYSILKRRCRKTDQSERGSV
jgi:glycerol uptake facilitator-like aquaporin